MRVLHVITSLFTGGAEKLIVDMLPRFRDCGIDVELCLLNGKRTPFYEQIKKEKIKIYDFGNGSVYNPINIIKLLLLIRKGHYDIVHTHNTAPQMYAAIASVLCSVVLCTTEHSTSNRRRGWRWYVPIDKWMYGRYSHVICISKATERNLVEYLENTPIKTSVIHNGIDISKYEGHNNIDNIKLSTKGKISIIQVAGFRYQKDQDTVIRSLLYLPESYNLYLVGDGDRKEELKKLVSILQLQQRVHFLGERTDVPALLLKSDIVVMSSHCEGFGLAAVEGMAAGKPVVASNVDGLRDVVKGAGILFQQGNEKDLANKIELITSNSALYSEVAKKCSKRAKEYDISRTVAEYINVYKRMQK